jgi:thiamine biosynthesis lipoprotein
MRMKRLRPMMGTLCAIEASGEETLVIQGLTAAFSVMTDIERELHPTRSDSDIAQLCAHPGRSSEISARTWEMLAITQALWKSSGGLFDPCLPTQPGRLSDIELLENRRVVAHAPVALDLGGVAKGFAIDQAIDALRQAGCASAIVNAGGDARVFGDESQNMFLRVDDETTLQVTLRDCALAVTNIAASHAPPEHRGYYNRVGSQIRVRDRAAIQAPSAAVADALTKCALYTSSSQLEPLLHNYHASLLNW